MSILVFDMVVGRYIELRGLVFVACENCKDETPQEVLGGSGGFKAVCNVCCRVQNFGRFVLHDKCKTYVHVVGFVTEGRSKLLVCNSLYLSKQDGHYETCLPVVAWFSEPIKHMCGQAIDIKSNK